MGEITDAESLLGSEGEEVWEERTVLTLQQTSERLKILGKTWSFASYVPHVDFEKSSRRKGFEVEGYADEHQYLHLEATDMSLTDVSIIPDRYVWLLSLDLSGNRLRNTLICPLSKLKNLVSLKLNRNLFRDPYIPPMKHLQCLQLKGNKIDSLHRIYHPNLALLDLSDNDIRTLHPEDSWKMKRLETLLLRNNKISTVSGIEYLSLTGLYLAENEIQNLIGIDVLVNLSRLHLRGNPLTDLEGFTRINRNLGYLNLRECSITQVQQLEKITLLKGLKTLVLRDNPFNYRCGREEDARFRIQILLLLPSLTRIDKNKVSSEEYVQATRIHYAGI